MPQKVFVHVVNRTIRVRPNAESVAAGEVLIGTIDHADAGTDDIIGHKGSHVLYQHVEQLMNKAKLYDHHLYRILAGKYVTGVNAGNDITLAVAATRQLAPTVLPTTTTESKAVTYASSDATKATVSAGGLVTGVAAGTTVITVTASGFTDSLTVTVTA